MDLPTVEEILRDHPTNLGYLPKMVHPFNRVTSFAATFTIAAAVLLTAYLLRVEQR